jgi:hypothetical protein
MEEVSIRLSKVPDFLVSLFQESDRRWEKPLTQVWTDLLSELDNYVDDSVGRCPGSLSGAFAPGTRAVQQSPSDDGDGTCRANPALQHHPATARTRSSPLSPNVPSLARRLRLSKDAVFSPRPSCGVSQNRDRRTSLQLRRSARGVAQVPRKPFPHTPDKSGMSQFYRSLLDAHIVWRCP